jgi:hypothetical protein
MPRVITCPLCGNRGDQNGRVYQNHAAADAVDTAPRAIKRLVVDRRRRYVARRVSSLLPIVAGAQPTAGLPRASCGARLTRSASRRRHDCALSSARCRP